MKTTLDVFQELCKVHNSDYKKVTKEMDIIKLQELLSRTQENINRHKKLLRRAEFIDNASEIAIFKTAIARDQKLIDTINKRIN